MRNKASRINGKRGIVRSSLASQFGNGPLPKLESEHFAECPRGGNTPWSHVPDSKRGTPPYFLRKCSMRNKAFRINGKRGIVGPVNLAMGHCQIGI
jgi:hypothetical protein